MADLKIRVLVAKPGLDGHDRGAKVIARALRDAGMEVIYTGLRQTPEMIVNAALQEDVHVIGLSILSGAHNAIVPRVMDLLKQNKMDDVLVVVGGIIPDQDVENLKKLGVAAIFQPGTSMDEIVQFIRANVKPRGVPAAGCYGRNQHFTPARKSLQRTVGPTPWYWKTFSAFISLSGQRFDWTHHGTEGALGYLVSLDCERNLTSPALALNTYCRPFFVPPSYLGVWCPEGRSLRFICFDPDQLKAFDFVEIAGWFKQSSERIYATTAPLAELEIPLSLAPGTQKIEVPPELQTVDELIVPTSYPAKGPDDPAFALYVVYSQCGAGRSLAAEMVHGQPIPGRKQWIPRAARDPESHRIVGECFGIGSFLLEEDGCRLERWL